MRERSIPVRLGSRSYRARVAPRGVPLVAAALARLGDRAVVVTDANVRRAVWPLVAAALAERGGHVPEPIVIPAGERSKSLHTLGRVQAAMLRRGIDRSGCVLALGGGVVLDVAGFAAATYMRGIDWLAVPTSLLGMVDAALGGKVAVDLDSTKNVVGAFHQPRAVLVGADFLRTLPGRERCNGLAEVVKYGLIADRRLFAAIERRPGTFRRSRPLQDAAWIARCLRIKARIVADDEREAGGRAVLNFGHTIGHALEARRGTRLLHGEAVALGMLAACALAEDLGVAREPLVSRLRPVLRHLGLPTAVPRGVSVQELRRQWRRDKKAAGGQPRFVLTPRIGAASLGHCIPEPRVVQALRAIFEPRREPSP